MIPERLNIRSNPVLTPEFARTVYKFTYNLPDACDLNTLGRPRALTRRNTVIPPPGWVEFYKMLEIAQKTALGMAINRAKHASFQTIGEIRQAQDDDPRWKSVSRKSGVESVTAVFLKAIFNPSLVSEK